MVWALLFADVHSVPADNGGSDQGFELSVAEANIDGLGCYKFTVSAPGGALQVTDYTTPVIPAAIRRNTATIADRSRYQVHSFVDDETDPTTPVAYIIFSPEQDNASASTLFRFVNDSTELAVEFAMPTTSEYGYPDPFWGSGHFFNGVQSPSDVMCSAEIHTWTKGPYGTSLNYRLYGDPLVATHGVVAGGPFGG